MAACIQRADDAVLVETVAPVGTAEKRPVGIELYLAPLRRHRFAGIDGMLVLDAPNHFRRVDATVVVERDAVLFPAIQTLQHVHVIGDSDVTVRVVRNVIIPGSPGTAAFRQNARIGMQHRLVVLETDRAEDVPLDRRRLL